MISYINGTVLEVLDETAIIEVNGIGYEVFITGNQLDILEPSMHIALYTTMIIGERDLRLFGFVTLEERSMFESLISVSGVGPKSGLGVLNAASPNQIKDAIKYDKVELFTSVSGIGRKNASRIIIELKSKYSSDKSTDLRALANKHADANEVTEALTKLGYKRKEIEPILSTIDPLLTTEEKIKQVLKLV